MSGLVSCRGCARHIKAHESRCPFCGKLASTPAPLRWAIACVPLVMACSSESDAPAKTSAPASEIPRSDPKTDAPAKIDPKPARTIEDADADDGGTWGKQSMPPDLGATIEPPPEMVERPMATKYGGPPRPAPKYGAPPRPTGGSGPLAP